MKQASGQMSLFDLGMLCGRTSPEPSLPTKEKTSASSSKSFAKLKTKAPMSLDLRTGSGNLAGVSWETGIPSLGASSMLNFGECPNVVEESGLWQILEMNVPQKYFLSETACLGVLRRAERRGKKLPEILEKALKQQIERWRKYGSPLPVFIVSAVEKSIVCYNGEAIGNKAKCLDQTSAKPYCNQGANIVLECYDARGNGDGDTVPTITGDHNSRITDYTAVICEKYAANSSGDGISGTIDASYYKGVGSREGKEREFVVCETLGFNPLNGAKAASNAEVENGSHTLRSSSPTACVICFSQDAYDKYEEAQHAASLKASGGNYGGGSENLVCAGFSAQSSAEAGLTFNENLSPTLQVGKCAAVVTEHHTHEEIVRMREGKDGGGKGALVQEDKSGTIACNNDQVLFQHAQTQYIVRRLTPLECCRLQGMPDWWCADIPHSDAQEYRMWGNGMALPNALYIMEGLAKSEE